MFSFNKSPMLATTASCLVWALLFNFVQSESSVSECPVGTYQPPDCLKDCPQSCNKGKCDEYTGECTEGCLPGYMGNKCEEICPEGKYGKGCTKTCSPMCEQSSCFGNNGTCLFGCKPGFRGKKCNEECDFTRFGEKCSKRCHCRKKQERCDKITGVCKSGCSAGWLGPNCQKPCEDYKFGINCTKDCKCRDKMESCDKRTGRCRSLCEPGWKGEDCQEDCAETSRYGLSCQKRCSHNCKNQKCDRVNGTCLEKCIQGHRGAKCDEECLPGTYGADCNETCNSNCIDGACGWYNGYCKIGCVPGFHGGHCDKECDDFTFGSNCQNKCRCIDENEVCNKSTGVCMSSCQTGWRGANCSLSCEYGTFGLNCSYYCGFCKDGVTCNSVTGLCPKNYCENGWTGDMCTEECEPGVYGFNCSTLCGFCANNRTCNSFNGTCPEGCLWGYTGSTCDTRLLDIDYRNLMKKLAIALAVFTALFTFTCIILIAIMLLVSKDKKDKQVITKEDEVPEVIEEKDKQELIIPQTKHQLITIGELVVGITDRKLNTGYFGDIWKARSLSSWDNTTEVALLIVKDGLSDDERGDLKEAKAMAEALGQHPNILSFITDAVANDRHYIALDYAESGDLRSYLLKMRKGTDKEPNVLVFFQVKLLYIAAEIACGLLYLSNHQTIHGNLCAQNIYLDEILRAKIGGFGFTKPTVTKDEYKWQAIETLKTGWTSTMSDLWSYGVLLWEIITVGGVPYGEMSRQDLLEYLMSDKRLEIPSQCNPELESLIKNCWKENERERTPSDLMHEKLLEMASEGEMYIAPTKEPRKRN
ncbi:angiopoietin-1 receptor-like isoform X2 [Argonauta hians]